MSMSMSECGIEEDVELATSQADLVDETLVNTLLESLSPRRVRGVYMTLGSDGLIVE